MELGIEPDGVDFIIKSKPLTKKEEKELSEAIAYYKATGKMVSLAELKKIRRTQKKKKASRTTGKSKSKA